MFRLPISAADAIWGWEIYPPIEICLCAKVSHIIYYTYINHVNGEGCYGVLASVNTMVASSLVSRVTRIRGLPDFLEDVPLSQCFHHICRIRGLPDECGYEYIEYMNILIGNGQKLPNWRNVSLVGLGPTKRFFTFLPLLSGNRNILFVLEQKLTLKHSFSILPISKKILAWSACHGSSVNYMVSDIVSSPISLYMQQ